MTYNFLTVESLHLDNLAAALAQCLFVSVQDVDVADEDTDQDLRNWDALVLCEKTVVSGDVSTSLDIYVQNFVQPQPTERDLASALARLMPALVLFPAEEAPPSAYWLAAEDGLVTRVRLNASDDEESGYTIDTVEAPVARLPRVPVARIPEVVREQSIATPLAAAFNAHLQRFQLEESRTPGTAQWLANDRLCAWEKLVRQLESDWAPFGWCPPDLYRERLEARDELDRVRDQLPDNVVALLESALEPLDALFAELTVEDTGLLRKELLRPDDRASALAWWWARHPEPLPW